jgi:hypothetical protein
MKNRNKWDHDSHDKRMWVRVERRGRNKEKCVKWGNVPDTPLLYPIHSLSLILLNIKSKQAP